MLVLAIAQIGRIDFTIGSVSRNSWASVSPWMPLSKKFLTKVRAALGSDVGRKGRMRNGISRPKATKVNPFARDYAHCRGSDKKTGREEAYLWTSVLACSHAEALVPPPVPRTSWSKHPPSAAWGRQVGDGLGSALLGLANLRGAVPALEPRKEARHGGRIEERTFDMRSGCDRSTTEQRMRRRCLECQ